MRVRAYAQNIPQLRRIGDNAMAFQPVVDGAEITVVGTKAGQVIVNTFYATGTAGWGQTEAQALADAVDEEWGTGMVPALSSEYVYVNTHVRDLRTLNGGFEADSNTHAGAGGVETPSVPNNVAIAVKRSSGLIGRSARGRVFVTGFPAAQVVNATQTIESALETTILTVLNGMRTAMDAVDWHEVIVSRVQAGVTLPEAIVYTVTEYIIVDLVLDSMRRRLPKRGE